MSGLKQCCATGSLHTGMPTGQTTKLHGLDCYVASPPSGTQPKGVVVILPDAFGWTFPNNRILADCYAKEGPFQVYLPEFMDGTLHLFTTNKVTSQLTANLDPGHGMPPSILLSMKAFSATGFTAQLAKLWHALYIARYFVTFFLFCRDSVARPRIADFLRALKAQTHPDLPVATAGFCWGGKFVTELCWDGEMNRGRGGERVTCCGFTAHPSRLAFPGDVEMVRLPWSVAAAEIDFMMTEVGCDAEKRMLREIFVADDWDGVG